MLTISMFCMDIMAQPTPGSNPVGPNNTPDLSKGIRGQRAPLAPATLLLLGLGGAVTGTMVYRNTKKN